MQEGTSSTGSLGLQPQTGPEQTPHPVREGREGREEERSGEKWRIGGRGGEEEERRGEEGEGGLNTER